MLENDFFTQFPGFVMLGNPKIRVYAALKCLYIIFIRCTLVNNLVVMLNGTVEIAFGAVGQINPVRFYYSTEKLHYFCKMLQVNFARM